MSSQSQGRLGRDTCRLPSVILFGPQVTQWTPESLGSLQESLQRNSRLRFVVDVLSGIPDLQVPLDNLLGRDAPTPDVLQALADFATGVNIPDISNLATAQLSPLTVVSHIVDFVRLLEEQGHDDEPVELPSEIAVQGFCIGFLAATAISSSTTWASFEEGVANVIRLAVCIGAIVDAAEKRDEQGRRNAAHSVRWKTDADRSTLEALVDQLPSAYISCTTDERTVTVTLATAEEDEFYSRIAGTSIVAKQIGLYGCYHHGAKHEATARELKKLCATEARLQLPAADHLRLPLRSTVDGELIRQGNLHDVAIDSILTRRAHWYQTVRNTLLHLPSDAVVKSIPLDRSSWVPRSLQYQQSGGATNGTIRQQPGEEEVAIVGMACRFPRADSLRDFWNLIQTGGTALSEVPSARFEQSRVRREPRMKNYWGNFLEKPDVFDHRFFNISGREAKSMDPQQRLALQVAYEALESAGYFSALLDPERRPDDVGCYLGVGSVDYEDNVASEKANAFSATGTLRAFISGRISHHFGWSGPSITFDTACSSSAVAIHSACRAIVSGECSMALAGGVNVITSPNLYQNLAAASFLNPTGSSKAFDASANGYCRGEGCGMILLKRLSQAVADGDDILAVISGTAVNQGANCSPITVPHSDSQRALYTKALSIGNINPAEVTYVEAHGTGTPVGDPIEFESVRSTFSKPERQDDLFLGSVKDNIGHAEGASGAAGVIKTVLMLQNSTIPRQANFHTLSPRIKVTPADRIVVPTGTLPWEITSGRRVALVNNYGAAGSNAAIVVREHSKPSTPSSSSSSSPNAATNTRCSYPVLLSAKSPRSLKAYAAALRARIAEAAGGLRVGDVAYSVTRAHNVDFEYRAAFKAASVEELLGNLDEIAVVSDNDNASAGSLLHQVPARKPAVLCFGGQTGRVVSVSRELFDNCALLRKYLHECDAACKTLGLPRLFPTILEGQAVEGDLVAHHCMLFSLQYASAKCWLDSGLEVDTLIGHSFGQLTALCVADSISVKDALRLIGGRARLIQEHWGPETGSMLAIEGEMGEIQAVIESAQREDSVEADVACYNGPGSVVVAGNASSIDRLEERFRNPASPKRFKVARLKNSHAYHSRLADPILPGFRELAGSITFKQPRIRVETCSPGESWARIAADEVVQHTRQPVYFYEAVQRILARLPQAVWVEAGSNSAIIPMAQRIVSGLSGAGHVLIPLDLSAPETANNSIASAACQLWLAGSRTAPWQFHIAEGANTYYSRFDLPPYQFEQTSHWIYTTASTSSDVPTETESKGRRTSPSAPELINRVKNAGSDKGSLLFLVDTTHPAFDLAARGHAVVGQSLCPASMYVELAARCAIAATKQQKGEVPVPQVEDLVMLSPLGLSGDVEVYVQLTPRTGTASFSFSVLSQPRESRGQNERTEHGRGGIRLGAAGDPVAEARISLLKRVARGTPLDRITSAPGTVTIGGPLVYKLFGDVVDYAHYYRGVRTLAGLEHEAVAKVSLPQSFTSTDRAGGPEPGVCDPLLLDNFLQVAGIHVNCLSERKPAEVFMCTAVEEVVFSHAFLQNRGLVRSWDVYSRYESSGKGDIVNDIFVFSPPSSKKQEQQQLVMAIIGATFKSVPFKSLARSLARLNNSSSKNDNAADNNNDDAQSLDSGYSSPDVLTDGQGSPLSAPVIRTPSPAPSELAVESSNQETAAAAAASQVELKVRTMFSEIIEIPVAEVQPASTFDELGIDSLLVTEVLSEIQKRFGLQMNPAEFQECNDVRGLCRKIDPSSATAAPLVNGTKKTAACDSPLVNGNHGGVNGVASTEAASVNGQGSNLALTSQEAFAEVKMGYEEHARTTKFAGFCSDAHVLQSELVVRYVVEAFSPLGCDLEALSAGEVVPLIQYVPRHTKLIPQLYKILEDAGLIVATGAVADSNIGLKEYRRTGTAVPATSSSKLHAAMLERYPQHAAETKLLQRTAPRLADCLSGTADPIALLFGDASSRALLEEVYTEAPMFKAGTLLLADYLCNVVDAAGGREVRILELGAGTGGTTKHLVNRLAERGGRFSYTFTDLSSSLVVAAKRKFAGRPYMRYAVVDIEKVPPPSEEGQYDVILSTNCIHATGDLVNSTSHIRRMLRPDGILCLVELTRNLFWFDLVFGLLDGWWLFRDGRRHALAHEARWLRCLREAGFRWVDWSRGPSPESAVLRLITASSVSGPEPEDVEEEGEEQNVKSQGPLLTKETVVFKKLPDVGLDLEADIYYPPHMVDPAKPLPVALMIHGGGHIMLSRDDIRPQQTELLLRNGFLPVSIDYRLCPETTLDEGPMTDVADALAWARTELPTLPLRRPDVRADGTRVVAVGWSTGGTLALSLGWKRTPEVRPVDGVLAFYCPTDYEDPFWSRPNRPTGSVSAAARHNDYQLDDATWSAGVFDRPITRYNVGQGQQKKRNALGGWLAPDDARSRLALYMNWHGRALDVLLRGLDKQRRTFGRPEEALTTEMVQAVSPLARARAGDHAAPVFLVHPRADDLIPWEQAVRTHDALRTHGLRSELRLVNGNAPHLFDVYPGWEANEEARSAVEDGYAFLCDCVGLRLRDGLPR